MATRLNVSGTLGASAVMLVCGFTHEIERQAKLLCFVSLAMLGVGTLLVMRRGQYRYGAAKVVAFAVLVTLSWQPWYCPHSCVVPAGVNADGWHHYDIWALAHDH